MMDKMSRLKEELRLTNVGRDFLEEVDKHDTIPIPERATNGDMIKAVFGAEDIDEDFMMQTITVTMSDARKTFGRDWWYASYKKEGEQK